MHCFPQLCQSTHRSHFWVLITWKYGNSMYVCIQQLLSWICTIVAVPAGTLQHILNSLDINKESGPDNIPGRVLKICVPEIAPILAIIFTQSYESGKLPNDWLLANITPVFKKVTKVVLKNYRPISLTLICCKLMEHILCHDIMGHLEANNILSNYLTPVRLSCC